MDKGFYRKTIILMIVVILCQSINLLRDILMSRHFGTSSLNDIYLVSQTVVSVICAMVNSPMATAYLPVTTKYFTSCTKEVRNTFVSKVYTDVLILALLLCFIELIFVDGIALISAPGFDEESMGLLKKLILIQIPITFINIIKGVNRGNFQILQRFNISEITMIFPYLCLCVYLVLPIRYDILTIGVILSLTTILSIVPEFVFLYREGFRYKFTWGVNADIRTMVVLMLSAAVTTGIREVNVMFDKTIGSLLPEGSITMLSYASKLTVVVVGLISTSVSLVGFSNAARYANTDNREKVLEGISESSNLINFLIIPVSVFLMFFSYDIIKLLYYGGNFSIESVAETSTLMKLYAIGLIGYGFQDVFTRNLHAFKVVKYTMRASLIMVVLNIIFNLMLYKIIGAYGVAVATSISLLLVIPFLGKKVKNVIGRYDSKDIFKQMTYFYVVSLIIGTLLYFVNSMFELKDAFKLLVNAIIYFGLYFSWFIITKHKIIMQLKL